MQRQLLQISDRIPDDILLTLLKCFAQILSREPEQSQASSGPFIRAFAKIRDADNQQEIIDENEDQSKTDAPHNDDEDDNECTFNYKVSNVVTQEVVYSMGNGSAEGIDEDHEMPQLLDPEAVIEEKFEEIAKESEENVEVDKTEESVLNTEESVAEIVDNREETVNVTEESSSAADNSEPSESSEDPQANVSPDEEVTENQVDDSEKPQIDENIQQQEQEPIIEEPPQPQEEREVLPMQSVSLDDIQREIHEMQMFLYNKGIVPVEQKVKSHIIHKKMKKLEDSFKVDFCVDLKKRTRERASKSKAILASYVNDHGKHKKERQPIFDPSVPNTPEDFLKEKSVSEKINKKKQKIKHLDVSWQKLCDSQKKVYKHSNYKPLSAE